MKVTNDYTLLANLIETLDRAWLDLVVAGHEHLDDLEDALYRLARKANERALRRLAHNGGLIGAEFCDECAEVRGTVTEVDSTDVMPMIVYQPVPGSEPEQYDGSVYVGGDLRGQFFRIPGSSAYDRLATAELLRKAA